MVRSITEDSMNELHLFAGAGGGILGGQLLGHRCVCAVEWEPYAQAVLVARQNDGTFPPFPIWDDVQTFDGKPWRGTVDIVAGGFPCQDISAAGKGAGIDGERSGLWGEMARIVREVRPRYVFVENSPMLTSRGLGRVLGDLAEMGFDAEWGVVSASDTGAPHLRERIWIVAHAMRVRQFRSAGIAIGSYHGKWPTETRSAERIEVANAFEPSCKDVADADSSKREAWCSDAMGNQESPGTLACFGNNAELADSGCVYEQGKLPSIVEAQDGSQPRERPARSCGDGDGWWAIEPELGRVANGVAHRVDRLKAIGNGQVSAVAATAWQLLAESGR